MSVLHCAAAQSDKSSGKSEFATTSLRTSYSLNRSSRSNNGSGNNEQVVVVIVIQPMKTINVDSQVSRVEALALGGSFAGHLGAFAMHRLHLGHSRTQ